MGKNTMMKRSIREHSKNTGNTEWLVRARGGTAAQRPKPLKQGSRARARRAG